MSHTAIEWLGWLATCFVVASYFFARPARLRAAQMIGALLWMTYGFFISSSPVIFANILVFAAAAWTAFKRSPGPTDA